MKLKEVLCNTNILVLFFGFKLATNAQEISESVRDFFRTFKNAKFREMDDVEKIEDLYHQDVEKRGLRRNDFFVMLKFLKYVTHVEKTEWDQITEKYCCSKKINDPEEVELLKKQNLKFFKMLKKFKENLFDNLNFKLYLEKTKLFDFISQSDFNVEVNEYPEWNELDELRACDRYYKVDEDDESNVCENSGENREVNEKDKYNEFVTLYNLSVSQVLLLEKYYHLWFLVNKNIVSKKKLELHCFTTLQKYAGITPNNSKYSLLSVILIKCFEIMESED